MLRCNGNTGAPGSEFSIEYSANGSSFERVGYLGITHTLSPAGARLVGPVFTGSGGFSYQVWFTLPTLYSGIDINGDSDDRRPTSTGTISYPLGIKDNDALGREVLYGYIRRDSGFNSIFWNTKSLGSFIAANPYNSGSFVTVPSLVSSGALHLTIDGPYTLRIEEYDRAKYLANRELSFITGSTIYSGSGGVGYIQANLTLSGEYGNAGAIASARKFDLANRDYAIFLSYSGSIYNPGADFLRYQLKASNPAGVNIAISPLNDENTNAYRYLANTIIFDREGDRLAKMQEIVRPTGL